MKNFNSIFNQLTAMPKRLAMVLTMFLIVGVGQAWGAEETATLSFANKAQRTSFSTTKQVWEQNGVTFTNDKASSSNAVADYANPARMYASSSVTVVCGLGNIKKIVFDCNNASYATAMKNSIGTVSGATVTISSDKVTVTFSTAVESFSIAKLTAQVRLDAITVTYEVAVTEYNITYMGDEHITYTGTKPETIKKEDSGFELEFSVDDGYKLNNVQVKMGGQNLVVDDDYLWEEGYLLILPETDITGDIEIIFETVATCTNPTITTQPSAATYTKEATATALKVVASGDDLTYQWYSNTSNNTSGATKINGATNSTYTPSTSTVGTKYYYCIVSSGSCSTTSNIVSVVVKNPPFTVTLVPGSGSVTSTTLTESSAGAGVELPEPTLDCGEWSFAGWKTTSAVTIEITTEPTLIPAGAYSPTSDITLYAVYQRTETTEGTPTTTTTTDKLTRSTTGINNGASYGTWLGKTANSSAVYAGQSAGGNDAIQLRTNNSNSGIITTASGGKAKKVTVEWQSNTASARTLDIYGKNSAYSAATDLYSINTRGTKLGSIVNGTSTELTISGDYEYIGLRSNSNAMYLTSISIDWETTTGGGTTTTTYYHSTPDCGDPCASLAAPSVTATNITSNSFTLSWNAVDGATSYNVYNYTTEDMYGTTSTSYTFSGLDANTPYEWAIEAAKGNCYKSTNGTTTTSVALTPLNAPSNLRETITCAGVSLAWDAISGASKYEYTLNGTSKQIDKSSTSVYISPVTAGKTYTWTVKAIGDGMTYSDSPDAAARTFTSYYSVTYNLNGGSWNPVCENSCAVGGTFTICSTEPTKDGYNFKGWSTANDATVEYAPEETITVTANTTLYAVWEQKTYTVILSENGTKTTLTPQTSTSYTLPDDLTAGSCQDDTKEFVGWTTIPNLNSAEEPTTDYYAKGAAITLSADETTFYAVFATPGSGGGSGNYIKVTSEPTDWSGDYLIVANGNCFDGSRTTIDAAGNYQAVTISNNEIASSNTTDSYIVSISKSTNIGKYYIKTKSGYYIGSTAASDNELLNSTTIKYDNAISISGNDVTIKGTNSIFRFYVQSGQTPRFRYYKGSTNTTLPHLYKKSSGTSYSDYVTSCVVIPKYNVTYNIGDGATGTAPTESPKAEGTEFTLASADGLTKDGYSFAGWLCNHDSKTYNAGEEYTMPAEDVTFTAQWNELPKYTVTFYNKGKKHSEVAQTIANAPIECPTGLVACDGYTFAGWSTEELDGVSTFSKIEGEYTPTENITLYAVYAEGDVTTNGWVKVTDLSTITEGTYALLSNNDYAFNGTINDGHGQSTSTAFVFDGEGVATSVPNGICEIQLIATGSGFTMYNESKGYLYAKAASSGNLEWHATENSSWSWSSTKENWVYADNNAYLRSYNNTFRTYGNNSNNAIFFAKKNITSFTTSPACDPMITIGSEAPVMVTSAKDIRVDAVQNITISATNLDQNADKAQVSIKIVSDNSAFKFKEVVNGDGQATLTWTGIANATFDKTLCITYTPTEAGQEETATLTVTAYRHNGSTEYATATMQVRGRSLPEQFVLVANTGDGWVALPNTLGTGSTASIPYPIAVEVDNDADPTSIPQAPSTTIYKAAARSSVNAVPTGLRFTTEAGGYLQASASETNIWLSSNNSENMQSWTLNSTDFVDYSIRVNNSAEGHYLNYNTTQKKIGNYKSDNKLRILPVGAICEQHAAPEDLELTSVYATSATIQWSAIATATLGYEYRIGATGEWTKVGNITELELTGLTSLTNYIVYVRASVEGSAINCSYESEVEFTTLNCDDVPSDIHYASGANSVTVYWACEAATSTVSLYRDKEGLSLVETKTSVTSPCQFTGLDKFTTYYVQILAGGSCPSGMIQVSTEQLDLDVVEWMSDGVVVDVNTDETITVTLENEVQYGSGVGQVAEELFFSKYFEGSGNLKLLAIYNGTGKDVDLSTYSIKLARSGNATNVEKTYDLSLLGTIKRGQEIIFYTKPSSGEYPYTCSQSFLASKTNESGIDANPRWILCDNAAHNGITYETLDFSGDDPLLFYKGSALIDVFGVSTAADRPSKKTQCSGRSEESWSADEVTNMDYNKTAADFEGGVVPEGVDLLNPTITAYTARVIMFRKNTVTSGSAAVSGNETDFVTFASEWEARSVCKSGDDGNLTCGAYQELGKFDYADYYTKYETIAGEQGFDENARLEDGTIKIRIPNLSTYSCKNIKFNVKVGGVTINEVTKVPILIANEQSTNGGEVFTNLKTTLGTTIVNGSDVTIEPLTDEQLLEKCEACDVVVLASGKLTHEADGISHFDDLTIYPNGVFLNTSDFTVNSLLVHAKLDTVGFAVIENESVTLATNTIAHTKRIDAQYWYPFSLPYNCNIADITQANGEPMGEYGVHWGIQYYNGEKRQQSGTSAGAGQSSKFWTPMEANAQLKACQGYVIALFDAAVEKETDMRTIYFPPATAQMYTESGTDSKESTITSWNVNLAAEKRHHGWNFTGSPYISVFNPQASGLTEDYGLAAEVLMISGHYDPSTNEYLYDDNNVYVSIPTPNGAKYYDQYIASATSLKPFTAYFVQAIDPTSGNDETQTLAYAKMGRELPSSAPRRAANSIQPVLVELNVTAPDGQTDNTGIWVDERYTTDYEIAADLSKMYVAGTKPQLYTIGGDNEMLAYNALPDAGSEYIQLGLYAPMTGNYTLALNNRVSRLNAAETVELLYNNKVMANLFYEDYVITANKGTVSGYALRIKRRANVTTATDNVTGQNIQVVVSEGTMTIEGLTTGSLVRVYDMLGRQVYTETANEDNTLMTPAVPQGVYNISVLGNGGNTTFKVVVK